MGGSLFIYTSIGTRLFLEFWAAMEDKKDSSANLMKTQSNGDLDRSTPGCGFGPWRPRCLQIFAKPIVFLILLNIYCIVEGTIVSGKVITLYCSVDKRLIK